MFAKTGSAGYARRRFLCLLIATAALAASMGAGGVQAGPASGVGGEPAPERVLVRFKNGATPEGIQNAYARSGAREVGRVEGLGVRVLRIPDRGRAEQAAEMLRRDPRVLYAEPDVLFHALAVPNDPFWGDQGHMRMVSAPAGWDVATGSDRIVLAIIDTGLDLAHPDIQGRVVQGYDFANGDADPTDDHGHGTAVAGIAAATGNNGIGIAGLDWRAKIMPLKALGANGSGNLSAIAQSIVWASDRGASVINLSLGAQVDSPTLRDAVRYAASRGVVMAAATGNDGAQLAVYPAAYPEVIAVGAWDGTGKAAFSNYGPHVDLVAPGVNVYTTRRGGYGYFSGTSAAAPFVAGLAALARGAVPGLSATQTVQAIQSTASDVLDVGWDPLSGDGLIDVARALASLPATPSPPSPEPAPTLDTTPPTAAIVSPWDGKTVRRKLAIMVDARDDVGVVLVELMVNGVLVGTDSTAPFRLAWDTRSVQDGQHTLTAVAHDAAGNSSTSASVRVNVSNGRLKARVLSRRPI